MEISTETFPNALHVLNLSTAGLHGQRPQDLTNDIDGYGNPLGSVINFDDFDVSFEDQNNLTSDNNNDDTIPQIPSSNVPDQLNPEKYFNDEKETLMKVLDNPIFYNEATNQLIKSYYSYYSS